MVETGGPAAAEQVEGEHGHAPPPTAASWQEEGACTRAPSPSFLRAPRQTCLFGPHAFLQLWTQKQVPSGSSNVPSVFPAEQEGMPLALAVE